MFEHQPNVWRVAPIDQQPSLTLVEWSIMETDAGTLHLSGYCVENREGRASTAIILFDPVTMRCDTASGRIYQLKGKPSYNSDAAYTWDCWASINEVKSWKDVTKKFLAEQGH